MGSLQVTACLMSTLRFPANDPDRIPPQPNQAEVQRFKEVLQKRKADVTDEEARDALSRLIAIVFYLALSVDESDETNEGQSSKRPDDN